MKRRYFIGMLASAAFIPWFVNSHRRELTDESELTEYLKKLGTGYYDDTTNMNIARQAEKLFSLNANEADFLLKDIFSSQAGNTENQANAYQSILAEQVADDFANQKIFKCKGWIISQTEAKLTWLLNTAA